MKKIKFLSALLAAGALVACNETIEPQGSGENTPTTGEGYVKVAINMPTTSGDMTKAKDDQGNNPDIDFEDGVVNEYKVNDGIIMFFKAAADKDADANATFVAGYTLDGLNMINDPSDQVTTNVVTVTKAPKVDSEEQLYALVILNSNKISEENGIWRVNGADLVEGKSTLAAFNSIKCYGVETDFTGTAYDDFMMTNAPLSTKPGTALTDAAAKTLVPVEVYETEEAAEVADAAIIYVERVVAKVTLKGFTYANETYTMAVKDGNGDEVELNGWSLNVTNKSTRLVRNVSGFTSAEWLTSTIGANKPERFAGQTVVPMSNNGSYFRIYWGIDANYMGGESTASDFNIFHTEDNGILTGTANWQEDTFDAVANNPDRTTDNAIYCLENTMNYDQQFKGQTTTVVLNTTYKTKFGNQTDATAQDFCIFGTSDIKYPVAKDIEAQDGTVEDITTHIMKIANESLAENDKIADNELTFNVDCLAGYYDSLEKIKELFKLSSSDDKHDAQYAAIWNAADGGIKYYKGGTSYYYTTLIRHFNDSETGWEVDEETKNISHLGRYGVLRNNWYEVNIQSISGPGEPGIIEPDPSDPDDNTEGYIRAQINVLSWAKRSQDVDL